MHRDLHVGLGDAGFARVLETIDSSRFVPAVRASVITPDLSVGVGNRVDRVGCQNEINVAVALMVPTGPEINPRAWEELMSLLLEP